MIGEHSIVENIVIHSLDLQLWDNLRVSTS